MVAPPYSAGATWVVALLYKQYFAPVVAALQMLKNADSSKAAGRFHEQCLAEIVQAVAVVYDVGSGTRTTHHERGG